MKNRVKQLLIVCVGASFLCFGVSVNAQPETTPATKPATKPATAKDEISPEIKECLNALKRTKTKTYAKIKVAIHQEEADRIANNNRHVTLGYSAFLILLILFVVGLWRRQQRLVREIESLERDVARAVKEA